MLDPDAVLCAVLSALRSIPELVAEMGGDPSAIYGHKYLSGEEHTLARSIQNMQVPGILIAYRQLQGGGAAGFDGAALWRHHLQAVFRARNAAQGTVNGPNGARPASSLPHIWWMMMNFPIYGGPMNIRQSGELMPVNGLRPMDLPTMQILQDESLADYGLGIMIWPENGDDGPTEDYCAH